MGKKLKEVKTMRDYSTISVSPETKEALDSLPLGKKSYDKIIQELLDAYKELQKTKPGKKA
jgi:predicted CopG family antitoxin